MKILGISCFYHDSAASIIVDNEIIAAAQEESLLGLNTLLIFLLIQLNIV